MQCLTCALSVLLVVTRPATSARKRCGEIGRPRIFTDEAIYLATTRAIARWGYARITLDEIASDLGCTRQALARRFGSKH
jgi:AcrR family transcriptional regulator